MPSNPLQSVELCYCLTPKVITHISDLNCHTPLTQWFPPFSSWDTSHMLHESYVSQVICFTTTPPLKVYLRVDRLLKQTESSIHRNLAYPIKLLASSSLSGTLCLHFFSVLNKQRFYELLNIIADFQFVMRICFNHSQFAEQ